MTTARAVLLSAVLIALAIVGGGWWSAERSAQAERYQIVNVGGGATARLNTQSGDLIDCRYGQCKPLTKGEAIVDEASGQAATIPPPPAGFTMDAEAKR